MNFHVLTLFPEMIEQGTQTSIIGRALKSGHIALNAVNIRDYTENKHKKVDDYPYGGGAGMLMQAQPVYAAYLAVTKGIKAQEKTRVVYLTPQGKPFTQSMAEELSAEEELIFLCGHYEGMDERVLEEIVTDYVSIGDYVLTGGELPAMVMMDAISRLVPGVLHNDASANFETFHNDLLEYPQYSRPEEWHGKRVPEILLSGDHSKVEKWRMEQSIERTRERRPDMYERYRKKQEVIEKLLKKNKVMYIDMIENLRRGRGELIYSGEDGVVIRDGRAETYMLAALDEKKAEHVISCIPQEKGVWMYVVHQECLLLPMKERYHIMEKTPFKQTVYTNRTALPLSKELSFQTLNEDYLDEIMEHYSMAPSEEYIRERLISGCIYGAFVEDKLAGFAGVHAEGSLGMLEVLKPFRKQGIGMALEAYLINGHLSLGYTPYGNVVPDNEVSMHLQEKLGLRISKEIMFWVVVEENNSNETY